MEEQTPPPIAIERDSATIIVNEPEVGASGTSDNVADVTEDGPGVSGVHLLLMCLTDSDRHVSFHENVVDNEGMNRRKSKCCCIYRKPHVFGESSSSSDDECEHCCGHPEVRLRNRLKKQQQQQQAKLCPCGCHKCPHGQQQQEQSEPGQNDRSNHSIELAGDSGILKPKAESPLLVPASSQSLQP
ncbi:hypothetical protein ACLKA6_008137 [Drosophila palustris]